MNPDESPHSWRRANIDPAVYRTLLESTKAIPWKIDWATMQFAYIGPQIEALLGWSPESWVTVQDWADRIHPDERERIVAFCVAQSQQGVDHEADYRALTKDGSWVWLRDVVHVVRRADGTVEALVGFMFDISERKRTEERLMALQRELEDFSFKDGLTGIANRRRFDTLLEVEWSAARRNGQPLSLLMIDLDFFKQYNDHYGHVRGDECLRRVAQIFGANAVRPRDVLARYGGEEFALVLPETDEAGARHVAERCRLALSDAAIEHAASAVAPVVTCSVGLGSIVPPEGSAPSTFVDLVDRRLYLAKQGGRNSIAVVGPVRA